jgi:hypothetical protein
VTLSDTLGTFLDAADELDGLALANAVRRPATDGAALIADHSAGDARGRDRWECRIESSASSPR